MVKNNLIKLVLLIFVFFLGVAILSVSNVSVVKSDITCNANAKTIKDSELITTNYENLDLKPDTPYSSGALRSYQRIGVYNIARNFVWNDIKYMSFIRYFKIERTDGRPIYDDDGILDVSTSDKNLATEMVNYPSKIYAVETKLPIQHGAGFLGTDRQPKFKDNGEFTLSYGYKNYVGMFNLINTLYTNPENRIQHFEPIMKNDFTGYADSFENLRVIINAIGYHTNTFWGNSKGDIEIHARLTNFIKLGKRDWYNSLVSNDAIRKPFKDKVAYYSSKPFDAIALNLNNLIKINGVQVNSQYGSEVVPFRDGHHIRIKNEGRTHIELEANQENSYKSYYCFIDTTLPDISYKSMNENAGEKRKVGQIKENANGSKTQTNFDGLFRQQVQVQFGYDENIESPETAICEHNGQVFQIENGHWFNEEGDYVITLKDLVGNTTISKFTIDNSQPTYNFNRLQNDERYKITKWYNAIIPNGYSDYGTYSFREKESAINFACESERKNKVTNYKLSNINDFVDTHLVASGNKIKVGDYWYYKSRDNPNFYVYYFNEADLKDVIKLYASKFVSIPQIYKINSSLSPNNYGNHIDKSVFDNQIMIDGERFYLANDFIFRYLNDFETHKIYYRYLDELVTSFKEMKYGVPFSKQVNSNGKYQIKEVDFVGNEKLYNVFLDLQAPILNTEVKVYGVSEKINQTFSKNDIPKNGELNLYYEEFKIIKIIEDDIWWVLEIKCPNNEIKRFTHLDELPNFKELGAGKYVISIADRNNNKFTFNLYLLASAPIANFEVINANTQLSIKIAIGEEYNTLNDVIIYRNGVNLKSESGYDEFPNDNNNDLIFIKPQNLSYIFNKGGMYIVELIDNFNRKSTYEYKFEKDLPKGVLIGVENKGKTKNEVSFIFDSNKYFVATYKNGKSLTCDYIIDDNQKKIVFLPEKNSENSYSIFLYDKLDNENYNEYSFVIKTIKPIINLFGVENEGKTGGEVYATWEINNEKYFATYIKNDESKEYIRGQILSSEGRYKIVLRDTLGNENNVVFEIDKKVDFTILDVDNKTYLTSEIEVINFDIKIISQENLTIEILKNDKAIEYEFGLFISSEGKFKITLFDEFKNMFYFEFTIDKTPPKATIYGVENFGITNKNVWINCSESGIKSVLILNEKIKENYSIGTTLKLSGKYKIYVYDIAKNYVLFEFEIDKKIDFEINTFFRGISNGKIRIIAHENLKIMMTKNGEKIDYNFEEILNDEGKYIFKIIDELGNSETFYFDIINKKKQTLNYELPKGVIIKNIIKNNEQFDFEIKENRLHIFDEGDYAICFFDEIKNQEFMFNLSIDKTPPTLTLVNVENGGVTKKNVIMKNVSEKPYVLKVAVDGIPYEYSLGKEIEKCGSFKVELLDEAENKTVYEFQKEYGLNGASITVISGLGVLIVLFIIMLFRSRNNLYKEEIIEEIDESEIVEEIDEEIVDKR